MKPLSLPPSNILIVDRCDFYKDKDKYVSAAMKQKNTYQEIPTAGIKQKITYEEISTLIDGVMMVVGVVVGGAVLIFGAPAIGAATGISATAVGTYLLIASISKCLVDAGYQYSQTGELSQGSLCRIGYNIIASVLDRFTMGSKKIWLRLIGNILDESSEPVGIVIQNIIDK